ncbi:MAG: undecaprenyl-diphosphatase [Planctomycetota bacterium]
MILPIEDLPASEAGFTALVLLAVLQGLAEFLPISSSGHLVVARLMLEVRDAGLALDVALHVGTLAAVTYAYRRDVRALFSDLFAGRPRMILWLIIATVPVAVVGLTAKNWMEEVFHNQQAVAGALLTTAVILLIGERARRKNQASFGEESVLGDEVELQPRMSDAVFIGTAQILALIPGISRSGTTISAGLSRGLSPAQAARLSFLMSLPAVAGAAIVEIPSALTEGFGEYSGTAVAAGAAIAGLVGIVALKTLLVVLRKGAFIWFALYCALLAIGLLIFA